MEQNTFKIPFKWSRKRLQSLLNKTEYVFTIPSKYQQDTLKINEIKQNISLRIMYLTLSNMYECKVQKVKDWNRCLGTFQGNFSKAETSQEYFSKWQLPKCVITQAATSQVCSCPCARPLAHPSRSARPHCSLMRHIIGPSNPFENLLLGKLNI